MKTIGIAVIALCLSPPAHAATYAISFPTTEIVAGPGPGTLDTFDIAFNNPTANGPFTDSYIFEMETPFNIVVTSSEPIVSFSEPATITDPPESYMLIGDNELPHGFGDYFLVSGTGDGSPYNLNVQITATPIPGAIWGFGAAIVGLGCAGWGRRSAKVMG